ncbi:hypothetical protein C7212DRAFT_361235 [Tuber magnatum]|uniref:Uncharacterized protein n=1 Tax=Tuber magnatum TaxID=42249 RepID=A0A317T3A5_9PEZI|nr:hypothetical protein C7212DRAFT_361235 [Tuber magnatum]
MRYVDPEGLGGDYNHSKISEGSGDDVMKKICDERILERSEWDEGEDQQMDRSGNNSKDRNGDGSKRDVGENTVENGESGEIPTGEDNHIDSDDALGREENRSFWFKYPGGSTKKERVNATRKIKVVYDSSSNGESRTNPADEAISKQETVSGEHDISELENDLLSGEEDGGMLVVMRAPEMQKSGIERS